jgi:uncharacterized lipoprotein YddW (UPF0748 family)
LSGFPSLKASSWLDDIGFFMKTQKAKQNPTKTIAKQRETTPPPQKKTYCIQQFREPKIQQLLLI